MSCAGEFLRKSGAEPESFTKRYLPGLALPSISISREETFEIAEIKLTYSDDGTLQNSQVKCNGFSDKLNKATKKNTEIMLERQLDTMERILEGYYEELKNFRAKWSITWEPGLQSYNCLTNRQGELLIDRLLNASSQFKQEMSELADKCGLNPLNQEQLCCLAY